jgi:hypothetical protein
MFNLGDTVWLAQTESIEEHVVCDTCFGKMYITAILGDGSEVTIPCEGCKRGYWGPTGTEIYWKQEAKVFSGPVVGIEITPGGVEYRIPAGNGGNWVMKDSEVFSTEEGAQERAKVLAEETTQTAKDSLKRKTKDTKSWAWHVSYYKRIIKRSQEELERAKEQLNYAKTKVKEEK